MAIGFSTAAAVTAEERPTDFPEFIPVSSLADGFKHDGPDLDQEPGMIELGGDLFYSPDLSTDGSVSCASCHHPSLGGADGVALPVGIGGITSINVGQERIDALAESMDVAVQEGLIPRNSPTVINASLYRSALFWDGRVQYVESSQGDKVVKAGFGVSAGTPTAYENNTLLQAQARLPLSSVFEMKGYLEPSKNNHEIEQQIVEFLRTSTTWCDRFKRQFGMDSCQDAIRLDHLTEALAAYQASLVFTDSTFERYLQGRAELSSEELEGARLFFSPLDAGGAGCAQCHSGKILSDEDFHVIGIPASGRGANEAGWDLGRHNVDPATAGFAFRTPSLLNVAVTAPYFHNGIAPDLETAVRMHLIEVEKRPATEAVKLPGLDLAEVNSAIFRTYNDHRNAALSKLPDTLSADQVSKIISFLETLTDPCLENTDCFSKLIREPIVTERTERKAKSGQRTLQEPRSVSLADQHPPTINCSQQVSASKNGRFFFAFEGQNSGLTHVRSPGLIREGWFFERMNEGGVTATDLNWDCLDDLVFDDGTGGHLIYYQEGNGGFRRSGSAADRVEGAITPIVMDLDGDYHWDLFSGTLGQTPAFVDYDFLGTPDRRTFHEVSGPVINASAGDLDLDGDLDLVLALWRSYKSLQQQHIWRGDGKGNLVANDPALRLRKSTDKVEVYDNDKLSRQHEVPFSINDLTFTPNFVDLDLDGDQDLLISADFNRSQVLENERGHLIDRTNRMIISDNNGMGSAVGDFTNSGSMDWFVTSIFRDHAHEDTGNHLYRGKGDLEFSEAIPIVGHSRAEWSWGTCAEDFDNDGHLDLFYVSGFGENLSTAIYESREQQAQIQAYIGEHAAYANSKPRLFRNDGKGSFVDVSDEVGFSAPFDGRGIACFDLEQDGDMDIVVVPVEGTPRLYRNQLDGASNWLSVRLIGLPGNTEAFGSKIYLKTEVGTQYREVRLENNYVSRNPAQVHFGIGALESVDKLIIEFPKPRNSRIEIDNPKINNLHLIYQGGFD